MGCVVPRAVPDNLSFAHRPRTEVSAIVFHKDSPVPAAVGRWQPRCDSSEVPRAGSPKGPALARQRLLSVRWLRWGVWAAFLLLAAPWALCQQDVLTDIKVTGNRKIPAETIKARVFSRPGDSYDAAALERDFN